MTTITIQNVGFCAHFSRQGDWAFDLAFALVRRLKGQLNVFYFPQQSRTPSRGISGRLAPSELVALDRQVREYYDDKLGDFVDAGFRVCEDLADSELRRCLFRREYQVMVMGYSDYGVKFGDVSIENFACRFSGPIILVGPKHPGQLYLNSPAGLVSWQLGLSDDQWLSLATPGSAGVPS